MACWDYDLDTEHHSELDKEDRFELVTLRERKELETVAVMCKKKVSRQQKQKRTTILQPVEQKPHSQIDRQNEKAEDYAPHKGTR